MNNRTKHGGEEYNAVVAEAERFLMAIQGETLPVIDRQALEMRAIIAAEEECLDQILPALIEVSQLLGKMKMPKRKLERLINELAHASEHVYGNLECLRSVSEDEE